MGRVSKSIATVALALTLCSPLAAAPDGPLQLDVVLRVSGRFATRSANEPGFDVELLRRLAGWYRFKHGRDLRFAYHYVSTVPEVLARVREGADLGAGGITATPERDQVVDFSSECLPVRSVLVAPEGALTPDGWRTQIEGRRLGAVVGSTNAAEVERIARSIRGVRTDTSLPTNEAVFDALTGPVPQLDAAIIDLPQYWTLGRGLGLVIVETLGAPQSIAFVLPEGSPLKATADEFLHDFTHSSEYYRLVQRYFGADAARMVKVARADAARPDS